MEKSDDTRKNNICNTTVIEKESNSESPMTCPICHMKFKSNKTGNLNRHLRLHESEEIRYECPICHRDYANPSNFSTHLLRHHNTEIDFETPPKAIIKTQKNKGNISLYILLQKKKRNNILLFITERPFYQRWFQ